MEREKLQYDPNFPELGKSRRRAFLGGRPGGGVVMFDNCVYRGSAWNVKENIKLPGTELGLFVEMGNLRCLDFDRGESHVLLEIFPHCTWWYEPEISALANRRGRPQIVASDPGWGRAPRPKEQRHPTFCSPQNKQQISVRRTSSHRDRAQLIRT